MDKRICAPFMHELKVVVQCQVVDVCATMVVSRLHDTIIPEESRQFKWLWLKSIQCLATFNHKKRYEFLIKTISPGFRISVFVC